MTPERWAQIDRIHKAALEQTATDRSAYLDEACASDAELRREVESLLAYATAAEGFLERPAVQEAARAFEADVDAHAGTLPVVPGYSVLELLGTGGMGVVYLANEDPPLRRRVALKLIRPGMDSLSALARFEAERQALALMDHPNIAAVYGTGVSADRRPFVAMEFVAGIPITAYCDRARLSIRARLNMFVRVCAAIQHAHQKGVIHRDLKPSNVLVTDQEGDPVPKVIDFGTAAWADRPRAARLGLTEAGAVVGTLEYMSPEQAAASSDIDTTTDVYSLGVLLYELLVGGVPFDRQRLCAVGYDEMRRVILETDAPKPSSQLTRGQPSTSSAAAARGTDVGRLTRQLAGDLDWIVLRALEKDRRRRYATVAAFATDIERFLDHQPVDARPPSVAYRVGKFARRHRGAVSAAAALLVVLVAGFLTSTALYFRAEWARAETVEVAYASTIAAADAELRSGSIHLARERLLTVPESLREWEWRHLFLKSDTSVLTLRSAFVCPDRSGSFEFAPSERALALRDKTSSVYLARCNTLDRWDPPYSTRVTRHFDGKILALSPSGDVLISHQSRSGSVASWDLRWVDATSGGELRQFGPFRTEPSCADVSSDGARLAVGFRSFGATAGSDTDDPFEVWDVSAARRLTPLGPTTLSMPESRNSLAPCMVVFNADATLVASSGARVRVWRSDTGFPVFSDWGQAGYVSQPIAFSPDGSSLAIGRHDGTVSIAGRSSFPIGGASFRPLPYALNRSPPVFTGDRTMLAVWRRRDAVLSVAFNPDGTRVVSGSAGGVRLWDSGNLQAPLQLLGHVAEVTGVGVTNDGRPISSDVGGVVKMWPRESGSAVTVLRGSWTSTGTFALSAGGDAIVQPLTNGVLRATRLADLSQHVLTAGKDEFVPWRVAHSLVINSSGTELLVGEVDQVGTLRRWNIETGSSTAVAMNNPPESGCEKVQANRWDYAIDVMALSQDGNVLAYGQGNCVIVRDLRTMKVLATFHESPSSLVFRADGTLLLASFTWSRTAPNGPTRLRIWDWHADRILVDRRLDISDSPVRLWRLVTSRDGRRVAVIGGIPKTVLIWDGALEHELGRLPVPAGTSAAALSIDGRRLATTAEDATIRVWDVDRLRLLLTLTDSDQHNGSIEFTPNGRLIASRADGGLTIWETNKESLSRATASTAAR